MLNRRTLPAAPTRRRALRGYLMIDGLVALAILAFGLLAMTRLQARAIAQGTESSGRLTASQLADELLSAALVDPGNVACYTLPAAGTCGSTAARAYTTAWNTRVAAALPEGTATATFTAATQQLNVVVNWRGKESEQTRTVNVTTDVR